MEEGRCKMVLTEAVMKHEVLKHFITRTLEVQENLNMAMEDKEAQLIWWATMMHQKELEKAKKNEIMNDERRQFMEVMKQDMETLQKMDEDLKRIRKMEEEMAKIYWVMKGEHKKFLEEMASQRKAFEEQRKVEEAEMKQETWQEWTGDGLWVRVPLPNPPIWPEVTEEKEMKEEVEEDEVEEVEVEEEPRVPKHVPPPERRPRLELNM